MYPFQYKQICQNIEKQTLVQLAGEKPEARRRIANRRADEVLGMLEIAKQLQDADDLVHFLKKHIKFLEKEIAGH